MTRADVDRQIKAFNAEIAALTAERDALLRLTGQGPEFPTYLQGGNTLAEARKYKGEGIPGMPPFGPNDRRNPLDRPYTPLAQATEG